MVKEGVAQKSELIHLLRIFSAMHGTIVALHRFDQMLLDTG